jgi:hypothetical protein
LRGRTPPALEESLSDIELMVALADTVIVAAVVIVVLVDGLRKRD